MEEEGEGEEGLGGGQSRLTLSSLSCDTWMGVISLGFLYFSSKNPGLNVCVGINKVAEKGF